MKSAIKLIPLLSLFLIICAAGLYFAIQAWMPFMWLLVIFGLSGLLFWGYATRIAVKEFLVLKTTKHGLNMSSVLVLTFLIIIGLNYFSAKYSHTFDYSLTKQYTLSAQSKKIIDSLDADLEITYFYKNGLQNTDSAKKAFLSLAKVFETYSKKIKVSAVEINSQPAMAEIYGATKGTGEGFISYKGKVSHIESQFAGAAGLIYTEQEFINSIIKSTRNKFKTIYFIDGHGERDTVNDKDEKSVSFFKKSLEKNSFVVKNLNLIQTGKIESDADLIIIAGANQNFQKSELAVIEDYLFHGKPILMLFDAVQAVGPKTILANLGWSINDNMVFNILNTANGSVISADQPTVANMFSFENPITQNFGTSRSALFLKPHPLIKLQDASKNNFASEVLIKTSDRSVSLEKIDTADYTGKPQSFDLGIYTKGKYLKSAKETELVVFSDVDLASNQFFNQTSNKDLLLNSVSFLAKESDLVSISPIEPAVSKMKMTGPEFNTYFKYILVGLFFPMPVLFLIISLVIWFRRRHA